MPTYSYRCEQCGKTFERNEAMSAHEAARPKCPKCDSASVHQVMTPFFAKTSKKS
jgi:putative FmdB family regulatory protein